MKNYSCKDCPDRYVTEHSNCHATCKDYLDASKQRREELDRIKKIKDTGQSGYGSYERLCKNKQILQIGLNLNLILLAEEIITESKIFQIWAICEVLNGF